MHRDVCRNSWIIPTMTFYVLGMQRHTHVSIATHTRLRASTSPRQLAASLTPCLSSRTSRTGGFSNREMCCMRHAHHLPNTHNPRAGTFVLSADHMRVHSNNSTEGQHSMISAGRASVQNFSTSGDTTYSGTDTLTHFLTCGAVHRM